MMKRRSFMGSLAVMGAAAVAGKVQGMENNPELTDEEIKKQLADVKASRPLLQRPDGDKMSAVWSVEAPSTGWIEWGETPDLGQTARDSSGGLFPYEERFLSATMTGLKPGTVYYYRTATCGVHFERYGKLFVGEPVYSDVYSFTTADPGKDTAKFAIFSDTHERHDYLESLAKRTAELNPEALFWNGDLDNDTNSANQAINGILKGADSDWFSTRPVLLSAGNHDHRGPWARNLPQIFLPRNETSEKYRSLIYNYAYRLGPVAVIGLDTGEDKPDFHPIWCGLSDFDRLRVLQAEWLDETLSLPEIASAPYVVAVCHIPIYPIHPEDNPGEILEGSADWQSRCAELWTPVLNKHKVQVVVTGHMHALFPADKADDSRTWAQMHCGGPEEGNWNWTIIHGSVENGRLMMRREILPKGECVEELAFDPRG